MMSLAPSSSEGVYFYIHARAVLTVDEARDLSPYKNPNTHEIERKNFNTKGQE